MRMKKGFLELRATAIAECRVTTLAIVEYLDEFKQRLLRLAMGFVILVTHRVAIHSAGRPFTITLSCIINFICACYLSLRLS